MNIIIIFFKVQCLVRSVKRNVEFLSSAYIVMESFVLVVHTLKDMDVQE